MQPNEHATVSQRLRVASNLAGGAFPVTLQLTYDDDNGYSYTSSEVVGVAVVAPTATVQLKPGRPQVVIEQVITDPPLPSAGSQFTLTLTLHNVGSGGARNVLLANGTPSKFAAVGAGNVISVGSIERGKSVQAAVRLVADRSAEAGLHVHPLSLEYDNSGGEHFTSQQNAALTLQAASAEQTVHSRWSSSLRMRPNRLHSRPASPLP